MSKEIQYDELGTMDVGKYFQCVTEDGKQYSECLINNCGRRLPGNKIVNLKTHLNVAHNMISNSMARECSSFVAGTSNDAVVSPMLEATDESETFKIKQNLSESTDVRKYFETVTENAKIYAKCLVNYCGRRIAGNHLNNMKRHLKSVHDTHSSDDDDDALKSTIVPSMSESAILNEESARKYFRFVTANGRLYSKCLIRGCKRRLADNTFSSLKRNLRSHKMKIQSNNSTTFNGRKYFQCFIENGKLYSKCLIDKCNYRLAGNHSGNLKRHLNGFHNMKIPIPTKTTLGIAKYFQMIEIDGKGFTQCLVKGCSHRIFGNNFDSQKRHLVIAHKINMQSAREHSMRNRKSQSNGNNQSRLITRSNVTERRGIAEQFIHTKSKSTLNKDVTKTSETVNQKNLNDRKNGETVCDVERSNSSTSAKCASIDSNSHSYERNTEWLPNLLENTEARKYFEKFDVNGKVYSKCLLNGCTFRMAGNHLGNFKRHLINIHKNGREFNQFYTENGKEYAKCIVAGCSYVVSANYLWRLIRHVKLHNLHSNSLSTENGRTTASNESKNPANSDVPTSTSTMASCSSHPTEIHLDNLKTDPSEAPQMSSLSLNDTTNSSMSEESNDVPEIDSNSAINVREYFEFIEMGDEETAMRKVYSKCLIENCNFQMVGTKSGNMKRHLNGVHEMRIPKQKKGQRVDIENVRKFYRTVTESGKKYSVCLMKNCTYRMSGIHLWNLRRHLSSRHCMSLRSTTQCTIDNSSSVGETLTDDPGQLTMDDVSVENNSNVSVVLDECKEFGENMTLTSTTAHPDTEECPVVNASQVSSTVDNVRKYFQTVTDGSKTYSKCLVKNCERRISGKRRWDLKQHLIRMHYRKLQSTTICRFCFQHKDDAINIFSQNFHIANIIRLHFPSDEVKL